MYVFEYEKDKFVLFNPDEHRLFLPFDIETHIVRRADGTSKQEDKQCEPYLVEVRPASAILALSVEEQEKAGIFNTIPFVAPKGKKPTGPVRFIRENGKVSEVYDVKDIPPPVVLTPEEKLANAGLTKEDLRAILKE